MRQKVLDEKFDYFFSIEADVIPPADVIERLIADDKDVVCGIYCNYNRKPSTVQDASGKSFQADIPEFVPMVWDFPKTGDRSVGIVQQSGIEESFPSRLREVSTCGLGCTLIKREVLEKVSFRYEAEYFGCDDQYFGTDARKAGFTIWADSYVWCRHLHSAWNQRIMGVR
jgi:GT2 family glycosyltransferase